MLGITYARMACRRVVILVYGLSVHTYVHVWWGQILNLSDNYATRVVELAITEPPSECIAVVPRVHPT